jgi:hypothetical protein
MKRITLITTISILTSLYACSPPVTANDVPHSATDSLSKHQDGEDVLDAVKSNTTLVVELKDAYRAFYIHNIITDQKESINVFLLEASDADKKKLLDGYIKVCDSLKIVRFKNDKVQAFVDNYLASTIQSYKLAQSKGFNSAEFKIDFEKYKKLKDEFLNYVYATYSTNHFVSMTEETYWQKNDKNTYIKSADYATYQRLKTTNLKEALKLLEKIIKQTSDFQEYSIYQIELADQYVKHSDILGEKANEIAAEKYKAIVDQKKYSIYLFEAWLKWRLVTQQHIYGISKTADIPNNLYDKKRAEVALTILDYLAKNEKDEMAINEFLLMATHPIVIRLGDYPYGNQNTVEYHQTFDEVK